MLIIFLSLQTNNSCPQDRIPFFLVFVRRTIGGRIIRRVAVEEVKPADIPAEEEDDPTFCEVLIKLEKNFSNLNVIA